MLQDILILGLAVGTASTTLTLSKVFRWLQHGTQRINPWLGDLFTCAYCMGHWLAAFIVPVWYGLDAHVYELIVMWLAVTGIAALTSGLIGKLFISEGGNGV